MGDERGTGAEAAVTALEMAVADVGALLLRVQRYRLGTGPEGIALGQEALQLGDHARALHRHGTLDAAAAATLLDRTHDLAARLEALLVSVRAAPAYAAAVAARARGDGAALVRLLPAVFADLDAVPTPPRLYQAVAWRRRGRPRPVPDLVAEVVRAREEGLPPEGDDLSRGADTALPAVVLLPAPPPDEPLVLCLDPALVGPHMLRLTDTGEYLVHTTALRALAGAYVATALPEDEIEANPLDYEGFRRELTAALAAAGVTVLTPADAA